MEYLSLLNLGIAFLENFLAGLKNKLPAEIVTSLQATINALAAHKDDELTKANFEAQRG